MNSEQRKISVMLADDHPLMCYALKGFIKESADMEVLAEVNNGEEAVRVAGELKPDVIIMDISMPKMNGLEATRIIKSKSPGTIILVLTVHDDIEHIFGIFEAGADGYLTKDVLGDEIIQSIRSLIAGETILSPSIFKQLLKRASARPVKPLKTSIQGALTVREQEILLLLAKGNSNKEIAVQSNLSERTVKSYLVQIYSKLGVESRTEAALVGLRSGLFTLDELD